MTSLKRTLLAIAAGTSVLAAVAAPAGAHPAVRSDAVSAWNANAGDAAIAACLAPANNPLHEARMYAAMHVAIHDALNAIQRRSRPYAFVAQHPLPDASPDAAIAAAARDVLVPLLEQLPAPFSDCAPAGVSGVEDDYAAALSAIADGRAKEQGVQIGRAAAAVILAVRTDDGANTPLFDTAYPQGTAPGTYRFTPGFSFAFAPGWADVTPFVLRNSSQFRPSPPYKVTSRRYTADFAEVKRLGGDGITTPSERTAEQTEIARFWVESAPLQYNFWRPVTAIQEADTDGNPNTSADPTWTPLVPTPPIPDYDSAHSVEGGAAAQVLRQFFGTDRIAFSTCSLTLPSGSTCDNASPVTRRYRSFSQAADENGLSRILVGFHFRKAVEEGIEHGTRIGGRAVDRFMLPCTDWSAVRVPARGRASPQPELGPR
jgi:hypothetical protein